MFHTEPAQLHANTTQQAQQLQPFSIISQISLLESLA